MDKRFIFLNGPPRSGKDACAHFIEYFCDATPMKFATPLYNGVGGVFGLDPMQWSFYYENAKETPLPQLENLSPREAMIWLSEEVMKPNFGQDVFGRNFVHRARAESGQRFAVSDSGFVTEAQAVLDQFGAANCLLIRIERPGHNFEGDSRSYISLPCTTIDLCNDRDLDALKNRVCEVANRFYYNDMEHCA